jgi:hypothetical protein
MAVVSSAKKDPSSAKCGAIEIGEAAGVVWMYLHEHGETSQAKLIKDLELPRDLLMKALGWLAREDKLVFGAGRTATLSLRAADVSSSDGGEQ